MSFTQNQRQLLLPNPTTLVSSVLFMKKFTGALLSHIAYARNLFREDDFVDKMFDGERVKLIRHSLEGSPGANCLSKWIDGAFDALDKQYLKTLSLEILSEENHVLETYCFTFNYKGSCTSIECKSPDEIDSVLETGPIQASVRNMIRNVYVMTSTMAVLPNTCTTSLKLSYYEDVTPSEYEPPNFKKFNGPPPISEDTMSKISCGSVETNFHLLSVKTKYKISSDKENSSTTKNSSTRVSTVRCLCELTDQTTNMIECAGCNTLQHNACYKILRDEGASQQYHTCLKCRGSERTNDFSAEECVFRRVLAECFSNKSLSVNKLQRSINFDGHNAILHLKRLQREGFINKTSNPLSLNKPDIMHSVAKNALSTLKRKFFTH